MADQDHLFYIIKHPSELKTEQIDFTDQLASGETVASCVISAIDLSDNSDATSIVLDQTTKVVSSPNVSIQLKAGADGKRYKVTFAASGSGSPANIYYAHIVMAVYDTANTIAKFIGNIRRLIQDTAEILKLDELENFIVEALSYYSKDKPYRAIHDITTGDGSTYQFALPDEWVQDFSYILSIEYPAGEQVPVYLETGDYTVYQLTSTSYKIHFYSTVPGSGKTARVRYTLSYTLATIGNIPGQDQDAFCLLSAALCCYAIARYYAQTSDSLIDADSVDYRSKGDEYARRGKELAQRYSNFMGKKEGTPSAAGGTKDWDTDYSFGGDFLTHPRRGR